MYRTSFTAARVLLLLALGAVTLAAPAEAYPRRAPPPAWRPPHVVVAVSPWVFGYVPAPRPGWVWVDGHYDARGVWYPGFWRPLEVRPGWTWVPGHWEGPTYVEGTWREDTRAGWTWVEGHYDDGGHWIPGHWDAGSPTPPPNPPADAEAPEDAPLAIPAGGEPTPSGDVHHDY